MWTTVMFWLLSTAPVAVPTEPTVKARPRLYPEIPILDKYGLQTPDNFWNHFPKNRIPLLPTTAINIAILEQIIEGNKHRLLPSELKRAYKSVNYLKHGGPAFQHKILGPCISKNPNVTLIHGTCVTDTIASWIDKGFVAGPFDTPPLAMFRSNSLLAIPQTNKTRICVNLSQPKGRSFNDNIEKYDLEKIKMASPKMFGQVLLKAGKNSKFAKTDIVNAYKQIPARSEDLRYQGFMWQDKYFVELRQVFGAQSAVQNFDILANTVKTLAKVSCNIPSAFILRQLDDTPVIGPAHTNWCEEFYKSYLNICSSINLELAENCPAFEKAFGVTREGKVLGIFFDSTNLTWYLPEDKRTKTIRAITDLRATSQPELKQVQSMTGILNFISSMCPFMNTFKYNLNQLLSQLLKNYKTTINSKTDSDLRVWLNFLSKSKHKLPICQEVFGIPLSSVRITTDAAGLPDNKIWSTDIGCGGICEDSEGGIILAFQQFWPKKFIESSTDNNGKRFGNKTSTLEMLGILMPFILIPNKLKNQHVEVFTDNTSCVYGLTDGYTRKDEYASIFIRTIILISAYLGITIHVQHSPRRSSWETETADNLTRQETTGFTETHLLRRFDTLMIPPALTDWLKNPTDDWDISIALLKHVMNVCPE